MHVQYRVYVYRTNVIDGRHYRNKCGALIVDTAEQAHSLCQALTLAGYAKDDTQVMFEGDAVARVFFNRTYIDCPPSEIKSLARDLVRTSEQILETVKANID